MDGAEIAAFTVRVAALVVATPDTLLKTARYWRPLSAGAGVNAYAVDVAPGTLLNVDPPAVLDCHCTVGAGVPLAVAVKLTVSPTTTV